MPNTITATIGADAAPFKKTLDSLPQMTQATAKKLAAAAKEQAALDKKLAEDVAKHRGQIHQRITQGVTHLTGGLANAANGSQALSAGLGALGGLAVGAGATIGLQVISGLADRMGDAVKEAKEFRDVMASVRSAQSGAGRSTESDITAHMEQSIKAAEEAKKRLESPRMIALKEGLSETLSSFVHGDGTMGRLADTGASLVGTAIDVFAPGRVAGKSGAAADDANAGAQADVERLVEKRQQVVNARTSELHISERQAALDRVALDLEEKKGAIIAMQVDTAKRGVAIDVRGLTAVAEQAAAQETAEIERKAAIEQREFADHKQTAAAQLKVTLTGIVSVVSAHRQEVERLNKEEAKYIGYANTSGITDEQRLGYMKQANAEAEKRNALEAIFQKQRDVMKPADRHRMERQEKKDERHAAQNVRIAESARADRQRTKDRNEGRGNDENEAFFDAARRRTPAGKAKARGDDAWSKALENDSIRAPLRQPFQTQMTRPITGPGVDGMSKAADAIMQLIPILQQQQQQLA